MRILLVGAGGVGTAFARIAARRAFAELVVADYDLARAQHAAAAKDTYSAVRLDARDEGAIAALLAEHCLRRADERHRSALRHAPVPGRAARRARITWTWPCRCRSRTRSSPTARPGSSSATSSSSWPVSGRSRASSPWPAWGWSRACPTCSPATPPTSCSARSTKSASGTVRISSWRAIDFAPTFSIWTTIEECLNPPVIWERGTGWHTTPPFSEPEVFSFPAGIGPSSASTSSTRRCC